MFVKPQNTGCDTVTVKTIDLENDARNKRTENAFLLILPEPSGIVTPSRAIQSGDGTLVRPIGRKDKVSLCPLGGKCFQQETKN